MIIDCMDHQKHGNDDGHEEPCNIDKRVNCMACLVADDIGILRDSVATTGAITHALVRTAGAHETAHHLCAFDATGTLKRGEYWTSRVDDADIIHFASTSPQPAEHDDIEADTLSPGELGEDGKHDGRKANIYIGHV